MDKLGRAIGGIIQKTAQQEAAQGRKITRTPRVPDPPPLLPSSLGRQVARSIPQPASSAGSSIGEIAARAASQYAPPQASIPVPEPPRIGAGLGQMMGQSVLGSASAAMPDIRGISGLSMGQTSIQESIEGISRTPYQNRVEEWGVYDVDGVNVAMPSDVADHNDFNLVSDSTTSDPVSIENMRDNQISYLNIPAEVRSKIEVPGQQEGMSLGQVINKDALKLKQEFAQRSDPEKAQALEQFATQGATKAISNVVAIEQQQQGSTHALLRDNTTGATELVLREEVEPLTAGGQYTLITDQVSDQEAESIRATMGQDSTGVLGSTGSVDSTRAIMKHDADSLIVMHRLAAEAAIRSGSKVTVIDGKEYPEGITTPPKVVVNLGNVNETELPPAPAGYVWVMDVPEQATGWLGSLMNLTPYWDYGDIEVTPYLIPLARDKDGNIVKGDSQTILNNPDGDLPNAVKDDAVPNAMEIPAKGVNWIFEEGIGVLISLATGGADFLVPDVIQDGYNKYVLPHALSFIEKYVPEGVPRETLTAIFENPVTGLFSLVGAPQRGNVKNMLLVTLYPDDTGTVRDGGAMIFREFPGVNWFMDWVESDPDTARDIYENGYEGMTGVDAVMEYWHLEILPDDPWGESKWLVFNITSDPLAAVGVGGVLGKATSRYGGKLSMAPNASPSRVRTGRIIQTTGEVVYKTSRAVEISADLGLEYVLKFGAKVLDKAGITKPVSSEVRADKSYSAGSTISNVIGREVGPLSFIAGKSGLRSSPPPGSTPGTPSTTVTPGTPAGMGTTPGASTAPSPGTTPPIVPNPGRNPHNVVYGPTQPMQPAPGTVVAVSPKGKFKVVDAETGKAPQAGGWSDTPQEAARRSGDYIDTADAGRFNQRPIDPQNPRKIDTISRSRVYAPLYKALVDQWQDHIAYMRSLGSGSVTVRHNNASHRIALITDAEIRNIDPTSNQPWEYNKYKYEPIPAANEVFVRFGWDESVQARAFLTGEGTMEWGDGAIVSPSDVTLRVGPVPRGRLSASVIEAYNNGVDSTYYHVKYNPQSFNNADFVGWFLDAVRTDADLRALGHRPVDQYTPPPLWEMDEVPTEIMPQVEAVIQESQSSFTQEPPSPEETAPPSPGPETPPPTGVEPEGRPFIAPPEVNAPDVEPAFEGVATITEEGDMDSGRVTRYTFDDEGGVYMVTEDVPYREVPQSFRNQFPNERGTWSVGAVTRNQVSIEIYGPNEPVLVGAAINVAKQEGWLPESHPGGLSTVSTNFADMRTRMEFQPGIKPDGKRASKITAIPGKMPNHGDSRVWTPDVGGAITLERQVSGNKKYWVARTDAGDIYFRGTGKGFRALDPANPIVGNRFQDIEWRWNEGDGHSLASPKEMVDYIYTQHALAAGVRSAPDVPPVTPDVTPPPDVDVPEAGVPDAEPEIDTGALPEGTIEPEPAVTEDAPVAIEPEQLPPDGGELAQVDPANEADPLLQPESAPTPDLEPPTPRGRRTRPQIRNRAVEGHRQRIQDRRRNAVVENLTPEERNADLRPGWERADDTLHAPSTDIDTMPETFQPRAEVNQESVEKMARGWKPSKQDAIDVTIINGRYVVFSGHHRLEAANYRTKVLGKPTSVRVRVHDWGSDALNITEAQELADFSNLGDTPQNPMDNAGVVRRAVNRGQTHEQISAKLTTFTLAEVRRLDKINDLPPSLQQALRDNWTTDNGGKTRNPNLMSLRKGAAIVDEIQAGRLTSEAAFNFYIDNVVENPMTDAQFDNFLRVRKETLESFSVESMFEGMDLDFSVKKTAHELFLAEVDKLSAAASEDLAAINREARSFKNPSRSDRLEGNTKKDLKKNADALEKEAQNVQGAKDRALKKFIDEYNRSMKEGTVARGGGKQRTMDLTTPKTEAPATLAPRGQLPDGNAALDLGTATDTIYRDVSLENAFDYLWPESNPAMPSTIGFNPMGGTDAIYFSNNPDLAMGQGANTGALMEFDANGINGTVNKSKPTWEMTWDNGSAEFIVNPSTDTPSIRGNLRAVTIKKGTGTPAYRKRMTNIMTKEGWAKTTNPDGSITWRRPEAAEPRIDVVNTDAGQQNMMNFGEASRPVFGDAIPGGIVDVDDLLGGAELTPEQRAQQQRDAGQTSMFDALEEPAAPKTTGQIVADEIGKNQAAFTRGANGNEYKSPGYNEGPRIVDTGETAKDPTGVVDMPVYERVDNEFNMSDRTYENGIRKIIRDIESGADEAGITNRIGTLRSNAEKRLFSAGQTGDVYGYVESVATRAYDAINDRKLSERPARQADSFRELNPDVARQLDSILTRAPENLRNEYLDALWDSTATDSPTMQQIGRVSSAEAALYDAGFGSSLLEVGNIRNMVRGGSREPVFHIARTESDWSPPDATSGPSRIESTILAPGSDISLVSPRMTASRSSMISASSVRCSMRERATSA